MLRRLRLPLTAPVPPGAPRGSSAFFRPAPWHVRIGPFPPAPPEAASGETERTATLAAAHGARRSPSSATPPTTGPCTRSGTLRLSSAVTRYAPSVELLVP